MKFIHILILTLVFQAANAQNVLTLLKNAEARGDSYFAEYAYHDACASYLKAVKKDPDNAAIKLKIAETYIKLNDAKDASEWYEQVLYNEDVDFHAVHYLHYAEALKVLGQTEKSNDMFNRYQNVFNKDKRVMKRMQELTEEENYKNKIKDIKIEMAAFNSSESDFSPVFYGNDLIIVSSRENSRAIRRSCSWIDDNYLDLYKVDTASGAVSHFLPKAETKYHEGPSAFHDSVMYFTKNNYDNNEMNRDQSGVSRLQIYQAIKQPDGKWGQYESLPFNGDHYSTGHPALSKDGKTLYFSSDRPGGFGGVDLYKTSFENGKWSTPENMGKHINTEGNEVFPHIHNDSILFFSSNGHHGFGGLDIYYSDVTHPDRHFVRNMGEPVNSNYDDFGILLNQGEKTGYFSSNRAGEGRHHDDIYTFSSHKSVIERLLIEGIVMNKTDDSFVVNAKVELLDSDMNVIDKIEPEFEADYAFEVMQTGQYFLRTSKDNFITTMDTIQVGYNAIHEPVFQNIFIQPRTYQVKGVVTDHATGSPLEAVHTIIVDKRTEQVVFEAHTTENGIFNYDLGAKAITSVDLLIRIEKKGYLAKVIHFEKRANKFETMYINKDQLTLDKIDLGTDVGTLLSLNPIYFDLGKYNLNTQAMSELDKVIASMKTNPDIAIELNSYTDARGDAAFNLRLSDLRARASVKYMITKGIEESRISGKGNGETGIINGCVDEASCTEEEHQVNRRTEFNIVAF